MLVAFPDGVTPTRSEELARLLVEVGNHAGPSQPTSEILMIRNHFHAFPHT